MASAAPRIVEARTRAATAKRALAVASVAGFLAALLLAKAAHPGHTTASRPSTPNSSSTGQGSVESDDGFGFGSGSIAPSQNVAPVSRRTLHSPSTRIVHAMGVEIVVAGADDLSFAAI